jgi:hypothetical protein
MGTEDAEGTGGGGGVQGGSGGAFSVKPTTVAARTRRHGPSGRWGVARAFGSFASSSGV